MPQARRDGSPPTTAVRLRYDPLRRVPAKPAVLREKFTNAPMTFLWGTRTMKMKYSAG
ncbi:MAG: hypothetical protein ACLR4Z_10890 [Butyricicoccaceae bacterium]